MAQKSALPLIVGVAAAAVLLGRKGGGGCAADCSEVSSTGGRLAGIRYREFRSEGLGVNEPAPMLIRYHGLGSTSGSLDSAGNSWAKLVKGPVRVIVPESPRVTSPNKYFTWWKLQARTSKQDELAQQMSEAGAEMREFLCQIVQCRPTLGKPVVTGGSQGGSMSYLVATTSPDLIRGAVSAAGWLPKQLWSKNIAPLLATHGKQDTTVPFDSTWDYWEYLGTDTPFEAQAYDSGHNLSSAMNSYMIKGVNRLFGYS
jgi:phospholipase/carboxylesterase